MEAGKFPSPQAVLRQPRTWIVIGSLLIFWLGGIRLLPQVAGEAYPFGYMLPLTIVIGTCLAMIGTAWWMRDTRHLYLVLVHLFALGFTGAVIAIWRGLEFGPNGIYGDSWFSTSIVTKYADYWGSTDFVYKDLHSFYPSLYHYILGKGAAIMGEEPWRVMKFGCYWTCYLLPLALFALWKRIVKERLALLLTVVSIFLSKEEILFKPFEVISLTLLVPFLLLYIDGAAWKASGFNRKHLLVGGLIGAGIFMTYYYYLFLLIAWIPLRLVIDYREKEGQWRKIWQKRKAAVWVLLAMAGFSILYWGPLLLDMLQYGAQSFQNKWFQPHMLTLPWGSAGNWQLLLGLGVLLFLALRSGHRWQGFARALLLILVAQMGFLFLGQMSMQFGLPLLHVRLIGLEEYVAWFGIALGALWLVAQAKEKDRNLLKRWIPVAFTGLLALYTVRHVAADYKREIHKLARTSPVEMLSAFPEFTELSRGKVFLTNRYQLTAFRPLFLFISHNAHFSHPAARFRARLAMLEAVSKSKNPDFIAYMLRHNTYDAVDYVILDDNKMTVYDDDFPSKKAHREVKIKFAKGAFKGQYFEQNGDFPEIFAVKDVPEALRTSFSAAEQALVQQFCN